MKITEILKGIRACVNYLKYTFIISRSKFGCFEDNAIILPPFNAARPDLIFLRKNSYIDRNSLFLLLEGAIFEMKDNAECAPGLVVINNQHNSRVGQWMRESEMENYNSYGDVIVEEEASLGANVTLLSGVTIGRGAQVGAGSVCRNSCPPYSIVMGNPAKVVGFRFTPDEIMEHEKKLYPVEMRLKEDVLYDNYEKYYYNRRDEILNLLS